MVALEGLANGGLRDVWEGLEHHSSQGEPRLAHIAGSWLPPFYNCVTFALPNMCTPPASEIVRVFYNSECTFSTRLYGALDVDITAVTIPRPISELVGRAAFYARGGVVPEPCFRALLRLSDLKRAREMADIVRNDLLPSADEIVSLSANFSVPFPSQQQHLNEGKRLCFRCHGNT